uniref:WD repeat-containing protein 54 beta-propeller domain-containing protein n=1 Tax=Dunaliella tertiolecta TaxID=3047 RepID=A0A7S3QZ72_DUNTE|eukprot:CAMPEP_0202361564 /NCGR_PEP_ID=MMETSP1126-20121109/14072_1 /ASSEMBLY_ACC=CAM_ASM_000457 /TAXON_ID=3047 /ORGANISM="Dunaliella tertiolecta, Strain CCMP1320" /LENGTH=360 /DNA_ID=CAMNT_0048955533 /DNA_START=14 /DNA_END=1096 /DNA_ORIENTATION=-
MASSYDPKPLRAPMKPSPIADYSNLSLIGQQMVYAHPRAACLVSTSSIHVGTHVDVRKAEPSPLEIVRSVRALPHGTSGYIVMSTASGIQVWDQSCARQLFQWMLPEVKKVIQGESLQGEMAGVHNGVGEVYAPFVRGAALCLARNGSTNLCFGSSSGTLYVSEVDQSGRIQEPTPFFGHSSPITCMSTEYQSHHGRHIADKSPGSHLLASADEAGNISVWLAVSGDEYKVLSSIPSASIPATSLAIRHDCLIAARLNGIIQVYGLKDSKLRAEIVAHSRWLTCMDIHPTKDIIVSGAEDGTINMWTLPIHNHKVTNLLSVTWMHAAVTGVTFCGSTFDDLAAVAYDTDELRVYKPLLPT